MFKRTLLAFLVSPALLTSVFAQDCGSDNLVVDPLAFSWAGAVDLDGNPYETGTLVMDEHTLTLNNGETLTTRVYAQEGRPETFSIPGPTLRMSPGSKYVMSFKNLLVKEPLSPEHNVYKDPNVTNVHTHGVHISGESPGDDVTRAFEGQTGGDYVYDIPANHMGGTFWYHAHHHGSTFLQVSTGAFGLIIIDDANDYLPSNVAAMEERHLLLGYLEPGNAAGTGGDALISGTFSNGWTINGTVNGDVCVPPDTWQHWRMLVADQDSRLVDLEIGDGCEVELMARDGVWRTEVPKALPDRTLTLTGASRADLAVRCSSNSTITVGGVQVANILIDPEAVPDPGPHPYAEGTVDQTWLSARPAYLRDLRDGAPTAAPVEDSQTIRMGARTILGRKFDLLEPNLTKDANGVQEWSINGATNHPFHLHVYHVQVQSDCGPYEAGEYYDVIAGNCDLRFDMSPGEAYEGRTIFHCHILQHEDQGAMAWMDVIGGRAPPTFPNGETFNEYYDLGVPPAGPAAPTGLSATAVTSDQINLSWNDNSGDEDEFLIERSLDGDNFAEHDRVLADTESYQDTGLSASTTYHYKVAAVNIYGTSYSDEASATTLDLGGNPPGVQVQSIVVSTINEGRGVKSGQAVVTIVDNLGNPVDAAAVTGTFSGNINEGPLTEETGPDGSVTIGTTGRAKPLNTLSFCVTSVTHETLADFNGEVCGSL
jgi:FtsP/CotA-like multicopper oxidase with cupredoxin domain